MPTYDYQCGDCGGFDALRSLALRNEPAPCPVCGGAAQRVFAAPSHLALMESTTRNAMAVNERASHEPQRSKDYVRLRHPAGCGCCAASSSKRGATVVSANGNKAFPSKRPWMISH